MNQERAPANNSPALAADPTDERFVVLANRLDAPDFGCELSVSGDGGGSWAPAGAAPALPDGAEKCYGPEVDFDGEGTLYVLFVGLAGSGNRPMGAFVSSSTDRAKTFSPPRPVLGPLNFAVRMAIDRSRGDLGRIHVAWIHATSDPSLGGFGTPPNPILAAYSDDGGRTFSEPVQVSDPERLRVVAPSLVIGPDHMVEVAYYDLKDDAVDYQGLEGPTSEGPWAIVVARSSDGGRQFQPGVVVDDGVVPTERVMLIFTMPPPSFVSASDFACVAWTDGRNGDPDALISCTDDAKGRAEWSAPRRLNDDPVGNGKSQYLPRLSVSPAQRLDAIFLDRRADPQNFLTDVFYASSSDDGRSFSPNLRLSEDGSNPTIGQRYVGPAAQGQFEFGSRLGLLSLRTQVVAAWPDTRNSKLYGTGQDVFARPIFHPKEDRTNPAPLAVVLVGCFFFGGAAAVLAARAGRRKSAAVEGGRENQKAGETP